MVSSDSKAIFASRLRSARDRKGLSQGELAEKTGLQASAVSHFETMGRLPSFDNLKTLADILDVTTDYLLGRVEEPTGLASAGQLNRHIDKLTPEDRKFAEDLIQRLAGQTQPGKKRKS